MSDIAQPTPPNCPFYGRHLAIIRANTPTPDGLAVILLEQYGNQCAACTDVLTPCIFDVQKKPVEWRGCPEMARIVVDLRRR